MNKGVLSAIGNTPLIRLSRIFSDLSFNLYAKLEGHNPGGSMKDRPALSIILRAIEAGLITPDTVIIESSSGNMGVGLAQACAYYNLRFICVVDHKTSLQNIKLMKAYGAEIDMTTTDQETKECLQARLDRVQTLRLKHRNSFWPNQYANLHNPIAHHRTMEEIVKALGGKVDYVFCATSTCGTIRGCAEYVKSHGLLTKIYAVDAKGSVIFGGQSACRLIPGHGAARVPELYKNDLVERCVHVSDIDCVVGCRRLAKSEALLAGGSTGGIIMAVAEVRKTIPAGANCVLLFADRGERYLDTIYSDEWVTKHFGNISHLWERASANVVCATTSSS
jgi:2,3-diaminopropionate biosynthesis protein SbnA